VVRRGKRGRRRRKNGIKNKKEEIRDAESK
jgi:hypothetical protein